MASHDLINTKPTILGATLGAIPGIVANPPERISFAPAFSERFFKNWGGPRAPEKSISRNMGYRSDSIAISRDLWPLRAWAGCAAGGGGGDLCKLSGPVRDTPPISRNTLSR